MILVTSVLRNTRCWLEWLRSVSVDVVSTRLCQTRRVWNVLGDGRDDARVMGGRKE